jgi:hypothetical protein
MFSIWINEISANCATDPGLETGNEVHKSRGGWTPLQGTDSDTGGNRNFLTCVGGSKNTKPKSTENCWELKVLSLGDDEAFGLPGALLNRRTHMKGWKSGMLH